MYLIKKELPTIKIVIFLCLICLSFRVSAQSESYTKVFNQFDFIVKNFKVFIASEKFSEEFRGNVEKFTENLDLYLAGGYGFSFEELNELRIMKKYSKSFSEFIYMAGAGRGGGYASGKDIRLVMEYFPEVQMYLLQSYSGGIGIYRIVVDRYNVIVCRNDEKNITKKIFYSCKISNGTSTGSFGLGYKCYRKMIDNSDELSKQNLKPIITKIEIISRGETFMTCPDE